jgi:hypothetical protein
LNACANLVDLDRDNWAVYASRTSIATIITIGRQSADEGVRRRTEALEKKLLTSGRFNPDWLKATSS